MRKTTTTLALGIVLLIPGCFPISLHPLYTDSDLVFDAGLVNAWRGQDETWNFSKAGDKEYRLLYTDKEGKTGHFEVRQLRLGGTKFLDFFPTEKGGAATSMCETVQYHLIPTHSFAKVSRTDTNLALSFLSLDWLGKLLEKDPQAIRHERIGTANDQTILLTAPTGELQKFVLKYLEDKDAFLQPINLKRQQPEPKKEG
jgi:hypothetical protein